MKFAVGAKLSIYFKWVFFSRRFPNEKCPTISSIGNPDTGHNPPPPPPMGHNPPNGPQKPQKLKVLKTIDFKVFFQNRSLKSRVFQFGPQKPQKLKVLKTIDFAGLRKHFLENKSSRKLPQNSVFTMKQNSLTSMMREATREATRSYAMCNNNTLLYSQH